MKQKKKMSLAMQIFIALILAIVVGLLMQSHAEFAESYISPLYFTPKKHCHKTMPILWYKIISYLILIHQPVFCKFMWKIMHFLISWGRSKLSKYYVPNCETQCPFFTSKYNGEMKSSKERLKSWNKRKKCLWQCRFLSHWFLQS